MIGVQVQGRAVFTNLLIQRAALEDELRKLPRDTARAARNEAAAKLRSTVRFGKIYGARKGRSAYRLKRDGRRRVALRSAMATRQYQASAPGEAPARFTGTLLSALRVARIRADKGFGYRVFADRRTAFYRHMLEFGTKPRSTRRPRRFVGTVAPRPIFGLLAAKYERELLAKAELAVAKFARG